MNLTEYVCQVSQEDFGRDFCHSAYWNNRLKTTGGRFFPVDGHLDFNPKMYEYFGLEVFRKIVRHELCHYHLYYDGKGYQHKDADFKQLLKSVDGLRYAPRLPKSSFKRQLMLHYRCQTCKQDYFRKRRLYLDKYCCGRCHGRLALISRQKIGL